MSTEDKSRKEGGLGEGVNLTRGGVKRRRKGIEEKKAREQEEDREEETRKEKRNK